MSGPDYEQIAAEEERATLLSRGTLALAVLSAVVGAGIGSLVTRAAEPSTRVLGAFIGIAIGVALPFAIQWSRSLAQARARFFTSWAQQRGWVYCADGYPREDTPFLRTGDRRKASDFFSSVLGAADATLYQHTRITEYGSGKDRHEQVDKFVVLHFALPRPVIDLLLIEPHHLVNIDLGEALGLSGHGEKVDLESAELDQYYRISGPPGQGEEVMKLLTPTVIVKLIECHQALSAGESRFEVLGTTAAFIVKDTLSPKRPEEIEQKLHAWGPIASWLLEQGGISSTG